MTIYYLVLGSNFGFPVTNLLRGMKALDRHGNVLARSSLYITQPYGSRYQMGFVNVGVRYESDLFPESLLLFLKDIEREAGRLFTSTTMHRALDMDVAAAEITCRHNQLSIPHAALSKRRFMLVPLCELDPEFPATEDGKTFRELLEMCGDTSEVLKI